MYHFRPDLNLLHLIGAEIVQVSLAEYNLYINLEPKNVIHIMGQWQILDSMDRIVDEGNLDEEKDAYRVHKILGKKIVGYDVQNEKRLVFRLDNEWKLVMIDNSEQYETGFISPDICV